MSTDAAEATPATPATPFSTAPFYFEQPTWKGTAVSVRKDDRRLPPGPCQQRGCMKRCGGTGLQGRSSGAGRGPAGGRSCSPGRGRFAPAAPRGSDGFSPAAGPCSRQGEGWGSAAEEPARVVPRELGQSGGAAGSSRAEPPGLRRGRGGPRVREEPPLPRPHPRPRPAREVMLP